MYAYKLQVHRLMSRALLSLVLSRQALGPPLLKSRGAFPTDCYAETSPRVLHLRIEASVRSLRAKANAIMNITEQRYKQDNDRQVQVTTTFQPGE